jgi:hypothetical protein
MSRRIVLALFLGSLLAAALLVGIRGFDRHPQAHSGPANGQTTQQAATGHHSQPAATSSQLDPTSSLTLIEQITGTNAHRRLQELASQPRLSQSECSALCRFLQAATSDEKLERMASIKNAVMNMLSRQSNLPEAWETTLVRMVEDSAQHDVIRDYALQHLFARYEEMPDRPQRTELEALFWRMLQHTDASMGGTALLGLYDLSTKGFGIDNARLGRSAMNMLRAEDASPLARVPAFQVCALLEERQAIVQAVEVAQQQGEIALRTSAIAAIGALGTSSDLPLLETLGTEPNPSIRLAATTAIKRIKTRANG